MTRSRALRAGLLVVTAYVVVLGATTAIHHERSRPLYDAFVPPSSYHFVEPPPFFAAGNVEPEPASDTFALTNSGSVPIQLATSDGQFVVNIAAGGVPPTSDATSVLARLTPVAPSQLSPVAAPWRANGNAYRIELSYQPGDTTVSRLDAPATLLIELPEIGTRLLTSTDGKHWSPVPARVISASGRTMTATLTKPGYYLAATTLPELAGPSRGTSHTALFVGGAVLVGAIVMFLVVRGRALRATPTPPE